MPAYLSPNRSHVDGKQRVEMRVFFAETKRFPFIFFFFARIRYVRIAVVVVAMLQHITFHIHTIDKTLSVAISSVKRDFILLNAHTRQSQTDERDEYKKDSVK